MSDKIKEQTVTTNHQENLVEEFVKGCLALDFPSIELLCNKHPTVFTAPKKFLKRIKVIFNFFAKNNPTITLSDMFCTGCSYGGRVKQFNAVYSEKSKNSNFSFLVEYDGPQVKDIRECSQNKFYQDRLWKRMTKGLNQKQITQMKKSITALPDLRPTKT